MQFYVESTTEQTQTVKVNIKRNCRKTRCVNLGFCLQTCYFHLIRLLLLVLLFVGDVVVFVVFAVVANFGWARFPLSSFFHSQQIKLPIFEAHASFDSRKSITDGRDLRLQIRRRSFASKYSLGSISVPVAYRIL